MSARQPKSNKGIQQNGKDTEHKSIKMQNKRKLITILHNLILTMLQISAFLGSISLVVIEIVESSRRIYHTIEPVFMQIMHRLS